MANQEVRGYHTFIAEKIEAYVADGLDYIEAMMEVSERYDYEVELIATIVKQMPNLRSKVQDDAERLNLVEKTTRLPI